MRRLLGLLPLAAWFASLAMVLAEPYLRGHLGSSAILPSVALASSNGDVTSNVEALVFVIGWWLVCSLVVEPAKLVALTYFGRRGPAMYALLLLYQVVLLGDTVRVHAFDWWIWLLYVLHLGHRLVASDPLVAAGSHFPWVSLVMAIALSGVWFSSLTAGGVVHS